jgi:hypothetical protein
VCRTGQGYPTKERKKKETHTTVQQHGLSGLYGEKKLSLFDNTIYMAFMAKY